MTNSCELTLHTPLTKEDWDKLIDREHEHTTSVVFQTPQGREVKYIKYEVLEKIRSEIAKRTIDQGFDADEWSISYNELMKIIDKYDTK